MNEDNPFVFVVDDDSSIRESLRNLIRSVGFNVQTFASAQEFLTSQRPDAPSCLVLDVQLPGLSGLDLQQELAKVNAQIPIIFITGHGDIPMTVRAMKAGAVDFLRKPFSEEALLNSVRSAVTSRSEKKALMLNMTKASGINQKPIAAVPARELQRVVSGAAAPCLAPLHSDRWCEEIVGESSALKSVLEQVKIVAPTDSTVLIHGETGTGKELMARGVHNASARRERSFVKVNCAAIPLGLLESELFGHEKGAFTGAIAQKMGRFELADRGTLFLDEVGDIPLELQPKLLRVLQEREFERLGSTQARRVDVRLVAATHRDLVQMVEERQFRSDLYYRLNVFPINVPPLRERPEDIPRLVWHFADKYARRMSKRIDTIPANVMDALTRYEWPGNVRELQNFVERSVILSPALVLQPLLAELTKSTRRFQGRVGTLVDFEREHILQVLQQTQWVIGGPKGAAAQLGLKRTTLFARMKKIGISRQRG
jgi:DNA-binding NtrC family response regulator